jgi:hypothetical protein
MLNIFVIQRPQWKNYSVKGAAAHQARDRADFFDEDLAEDIYEDANIPNVCHRDAGTTASEFDGALDEAEDSDGKKGVEAIEVDSDSDSSDEEPKRRKSTKVCLDTSLLHGLCLKECFRSA